MHILLGTCIFIKGFKFLKINSQRTCSEFSSHSKFRKALQWEDSMKEMTSCTCHACNVSETSTNVILLWSILWQSQFCALCHCKQGSRVMNCKYHLELGERELKTPLYKFSVAYSSRAMSFTHCSNHTLTFSSS